MAEDEARPSLADVPDNILVTVSAFLRCRADRVHMAAVNRFWRAAVLGLRRPPILPPLPPLPPQLPWLFFPSNEEPKFYSPITGLYHRLWRLPLDIRRGRCRGSGDGGWLVVAPDAPHDPRALTLYNLNSGQRIPLPPSFLPGRIPFQIRAAAVISTRPYVVAAIALGDEGSTSAAFWSEGIDAWQSSPEWDDLRAKRLRDVICYGGLFFFLTAGEDVVRFTPLYDHGHATLQSIFREYFTVRPRQGYDGEDALLGENVIKRYVVGWEWDPDEEEAVPLMVVRYQQDVGAATQVIRVFGLGFTAANGHQPDPVWEELLHGEMDGLMLFLGRGCSMSFRAAHYNGFEASTIYFFDEDMFSRLEDDGRRWYLLPDMGRYSMAGMTVHPLPSRQSHPMTSDNAPPMWLWLH